MSTHKSHKSEGGIQEAMRLIDEFEEKEKENSDHITFDFEINDYPLLARQKVCNREFIQTILDLTNC